MKQSNDYSENSYFPPNGEDEKPRINALNSGVMVKPKRARKPGKRHTSVDIQPEVELMKCFVPGYN